MEVDGERGNILGWAWVWYAGGKRGSLRGGVLRGRGLGESGPGGRGKATGEGGA